MKVREGQIWKQNRTPRKGDNALWLVEGFKGVCSAYVCLRCVGTGETKEILGKSLRSDYTPSEPAEVKGMEEPENEGYDPDMVAIEGYDVPRSNIYPKLFEGKYIIDPNFLIVYRDQCYGFDELDLDMVVDALIDMMREATENKSEWMNEHFNDTIQIFDIETDAILESYILGSLLPNMAPPTIDEAMDMARERKKVITREGEWGTIIGVHGKSQDRDILFLVRFDGDCVEYPELDSEIRSIWYYRLIEKSIDWLM